MLAPGIRSDSTREQAMESRAPFVCRSKTSTATNSSMIPVNNQMSFRVVT
jgi:hypothetical protein